MGITLTGAQAKLFNCLITFLAVQDAAEQSPAGVKRVLDGKPADALVLLGNGCIRSLEETVRLMQGGAAQALIIVGGRGHSTGYLRQTIRSDGRFRALAVDGLSEAEISACALQVLGLTQPALLGTRSENCGENAREALAVARSAGIPAGSLVLIQDPTMQRRSAACFSKCWPAETVLVNFAPFVPLLLEADGEAAFADPRSAAWPAERFFSLVLGEIPRLLDNERGYGPRGRNFIAHVDVPSGVLEAYRILRPQFEDLEILRCREMPGG